jgi:methionine-gamma-lyase
MKKEMHPESLMMSHGFDPHDADGSVKPPIHLTSTFSFKTAEEGKAHFELAYGLREKTEKDNSGFIYSRIDNPTLQIAEQRLALWAKADDCALFQSGMAAITTVLLEFLKPGDLLLYSSPTYGGTDHFINDYLTSIGIEILDFRGTESKQSIVQKLMASGKADKLAFIYIETPANPTNEIVDIEMCCEIADELSRSDRKILVGVDNTYMGPIWSNPLLHGADLVMYSATKYIGGHSDLVAGAVLGDSGIMARVRTLRTFLGNMTSPHTSWMLMRSLETLSLRMEKQAQNAQTLAQLLNHHPLVDKVEYLGLLEPEDDQYALFRKQYSSPGAMISFYIKGGEAEAFAFLDGLNLVKLAVSLGSTESLAQHPASMTHIGVDPEQRAKIGITDCLIRLSVGIENIEDLISDITSAFSAVNLVENPRKVAPLLQPV